MIFCGICFSQILQTTSFEGSYKIADQKSNNKHVSNNAEIFLSTSILASNSLEAQLENEPISAPIS
jgi:hypothetical protein